MSFKRLRSLPADASSAMELSFKRSAFSVVSNIDCFPKVNQKLSRNLDCSSVDNCQVYHVDHQEFTWLLKCYLRYTQKKECKLHREDSAQKGDYFTAIRILYPKQSLAVGLGLGGLLGRILAQALNGLSPDRQGFLKDVHRSLHLSTKGRVVTTSRSCPSSSNRE